MIVTYKYSIDFHNYRYFSNIMLIVKDCHDYNAMDDDVLNAFEYYLPLLFLEDCNVDGEGDSRIQLVYYRVVYSLTNDVYDGLIEAFEN